MIIAIRPAVKKLLLTVLVVLWLLLLYYDWQRVQAQQNVSDLAQLQQQAQRLARLQSGRSTLSPAPQQLTSLIEQAARHHHLTLLEITLGQDDISVALPQVPFERVNAWLADLQRNHGIHIQKLQVTALPETGMVRVATLRLQG